MLPNGQRVFIGEISQSSNFYFMSKVLRPRNSFLRRSQNKSKIWGSISFFYKVLGLYNSTEFNSGFDP